MPASGTPDTSTALSDRINPKQPPDTSTALSVRRKPARQANTSNAPQPDTERSRSVRILAIAITLASSLFTQDLAFYDPAAQANDTVAAPDSPVTITIQPDKELLTIPPLFYGLNQTILPAAFAFRNRELVRRLKPDVIRIFTQKLTLWTRIDGKAKREDFVLSPKKGDYNWKQIEDHVQGIIDCGAKPYVALGFGAPPWLYAGGSERLIRPSHERLSEYAEYMADIVRHLVVDRQYPVQYVTVDNEPENVKYPIDDYIELVHLAKASIQKAAPSVKVGGPVTGYATWEQPDGKKLSFSSSSRYLKDKETPLDFIDWHVYATAPSVIMRTAAAVKDIYSPQTEMILSELNRDWRYATAKDQATAISNNAGWDSVAWLVYLYDHLQRAGVSQVHYFDLNSNPFGLMNYDNTLVRPNYFTFWACTSLLGRKRVAADSSSPAAGVIATRNGASITALIYNRASSDIAVDIKGITAASMIVFSSAWFETNKAITNNSLTMPVWENTPAANVPAGGFIVVRTDAQK
ncbi:MAG: hypothetical protein HZC28_06510 [Spirochaetes bacterium]|nr:hypothetical protein [Spirochaetota bacterium]